MKKTIECYDNVIHKEYINLILSMNFENVFAEDIRWLKKFNYIPQNNCLSCNCKISKYQILCLKCKDKQSEISSLEHYFQNKKPQL